MLLAVIIGVVFVVTVMLVMTVTTPVETPADRLTRYVQAGRRGSPGVAAAMLSANDRLFAPAVQWLIERAASTAPQRVRKSVAADLAMAGSGVSPTVFLGVRGVLMFGLPALAGLYILAA